MAVDSSCAICLMEPIPKKAISFANTCLHSFCFSCLCNWAKVQQSDTMLNNNILLIIIASHQVKSVCPLCKGKFDSILYNIKENQEYEEYAIPKPVQTFRGIRETSGRVRPATVTPVIFLDDSDTEDSDTDHSDMGHQDSDLCPSGFRRKQDKNEFAILFLKCAPLF